MEGRRTRALAHVLLLLICACGANLSVPVPGVAESGGQTGRLDGPDSPSVSASSDSRRSDAFETPLSTGVEFSYGVAEFMKLRSGGRGENFLSAFGGMMTGFRTELSLPVRKTNRFTLSYLRVRDDRTLAGAARNGTAFFHTFTLDPADLSHERLSSAVGFLEGSIRVPTPGPGRVKPFFKLGLFRADFDLLYSISRTGDPDWATMRSGGSMPGITVGAGIEGPLERGWKAGIYLDYRYASTHLYASPGDLSGKAFTTMSAAETVRNMNDADMSMKIEGWGVFGSVGREMR